MAPLAGFLTSTAGKNYVAVCGRWGVDPGGAFSDDVIAHNVRVAASVVDVRMRADAAADIPELDTPGVHTDLDAQIRVMEAQRGR